MKQPAMIVFVCEHGAAKSIMAAAYFNKMAAERNLPLTAIARGTHPEAALSPKAVAGLGGDGLTADESVPTKLEREDLEAAQRVVSFCPLPEEYREQASVEFWEDVPPVSADYQKARDAILAHLEGLLNRL